MSNNPTAIYSQNAATSTSTGLTVDTSAFTQGSSCLIVITGSATVLLQGTVNPTDPNLWVTCGTYTGSVWVTIPDRVPYMRTVVSVYSSGLVSSCFSRGVSDGRLASAQYPVTMTSGTTGQ